MKILKRFKKTIITLTLAFTLPFIIIAVLLALKGIWWGSDTSILASDSFHQYVIFNQVLRNTLHGDGSLLYTFTSGLGLNFYALSSYYLGSFLSPLVFFFDLTSMPDALYIFTLVKFGLIGLSSAYSLSSIYKKLNCWFILLLSTSFSLMSFTTSQLEINIWLDVFILIPLILLGVHYIITNKGRVLYFVSLLCLFIQNYYFGYMTAIFLTCWFLIQLSWDFKQRIKTFLDFTIVSLLSAISSTIILLPTYLDLRTHGEKLTDIVNLQTENSWYLDLFAKNLVGSYDTTKFGAVPMIYVGLLPLILALLFFTIRSIKWSVKLSYASFICFLIASFYLQPLDLFWQGMHSPNMFLHRYAWVFSTVIIYMAAETLSRLKEVKKTDLFFPFAIISAGFTLTYCFRNHYTYLEDIQFLLTLEFGLAYLILLFILTSKKLAFKIFSFISLAFVLFEISIHSHDQIEGLASEWHFPSRSNYEEKLVEIDNLVTYSKNHNTHFYRTEKLLPQTGNDSMKYNYNGISQFSSIRNRASSSTLDKLGFRSDGTNLNLRYQNNTLIADSLFAIKYNLATSGPLKYGFQKSQTKGTLSLYENTNTNQLAILTDGLYNDVKFTKLTLDNQTNFLNQLAGVTQQYYFSLTPTSVENATQLDKRITAIAIENEESAHVTYHLNVPKATQLYVNLPNIHFSNDNEKDVQLTVNNMSTKFTTDNVFPLFNVGYFKESQDVTVTISFPKNTQVTFDHPTFYRLDTDAYQIAMDSINYKDVSVTTKGNTVTATYSAEKESSLVFTLPYDKGWTATQNGRKLKISRVQNGLMKVDVPAGSGKVTLTFIPRGFWIGVVFFLLGCCLFTIYNFYKWKKYTTLFSNFCNE